MNPAFFWPDYQPAIPPHTGAYKLTIHAEKLRPDRLEKSRQEQAL
jgi:hypothetical protein